MSKEEKIFFTIAYFKKSEIFNFKKYQVYRILKKNIYWEIKSEKGGFLFEQQIFVTEYFLSDTKICQIFKNMVFYILKNFKNKNFKIICRT